LLFLGNFTLKVRNKISQMAYYEHLNYVTLITVVYSHKLQLNVRSYDFTDPT